MNDTDFAWFEQTVADVPAVNAWLSPAEGDKLESLRIPKRRSDWRLGRWTAKHAVARFLSLPSAHASLAAIEIRAARSGAPLAFIDGDPAPVTISLSHSCGIAACAVASDDAALGCDLEKVEPRSPAFLADYFTAAEQRALQLASHEQRDALATLLWSAKESALKAVHEGLRLDTRSVVIELADDACGPWRRFRALCPGGLELGGFWRLDAGFARTAVCASAPVALASSLDATTAR